MKTVLLVLCCLFPSLTIATASFGEDARAPGDQEGHARAQYRILFTGNNIPEDWAQVATSLVQNNIIPIETTKSSKGEGLCAAAIRALNLDKGIGCPDGLQALLSSLNPELKKTVPEGAIVNYPALRPQTTNWNVVYDIKNVADRSRYTALTESNKRYKVDEVRTGNLVKPSYRGYYLVLDTPKDEKTEELLSSLTKFDKNLQKYVVEVDEIGKPLTTSPGNSSSLEWWTQCRAAANNVSLPKPPFISLLGLSKNASCVRQCSGDSCPNIVLIDRPVATHPDLRRALGLAIADPMGPDEQKCPFTPWDKSYHGTHLAGIMVSDGNSSYEGIAPKASLTSIDRAQDATVLKDKIGDANRAGHLSFFVFASRFDRDKFHRPPPSSDQRFVSYPIAATIRDSNTLWLVAAGQANQDEARDSVDSSSASNFSTAGAPTTNAPIEIVEKDDLVPATLGDQKNVLVVTACENCLQPDAKVADWANYSNRLVGVAAPGGQAGSPIPSTATEMAYSEAFGTSQSVAFAGGLAAAMYGCYPNELRDPRQLKIRMEQTSRPLADDVSNSKVITGVLDAGVAMLDPRKTWIRAESKDWRAVSEINWCKNNFQLKDRFTKQELPPGEAYFEAKHIRRLMRVGTVDGDWVWVVYGDSSPNDSSNLFRRGPALIDMPRDTRLLKVQFESENNPRPLSADTIEDVLPSSIASPVSVSAGCAQ